MATMFEGEEKVVLARLEEMKMKDFLTRLLVDDWVKKLVLENGISLILEMTTSVKLPLTLLVIRLIEFKKRVVFNVLMSRNLQHLSPSRKGYFYEEEYSDLTIDNLLVWVEQLNVPRVGRMAQSILESIETFESKNERDIRLLETYQRLPFRFLPFELKKSRG